jgi:hypothetical protein
LGAALRSGPRVPLWEMQDAHGRPPDMSRIIADETILVTNPNRSLCVQKTLKLRFCKRLIFQLLIRDAVVLEDASCLLGISRGRSTEQVSKIHLGLASYRSRTLDFSKYSKLYRRHL